MSEIVRVTKIGDAVELSYGYGEGKLELLRLSDRGDWYELHIHLRSRTADGSSMYGCAVVKAAADAIANAVGIEVGRAVRSILRAIDKGGAASPLPTWGAIKISRDGRVIDTGGRVFLTSRSAAVELGYDRPEFVGVIRPRGAPRWSALVGGIGVLERTDSGGLFIVKHNFGRFLTRGGERVIYLGESPDLGSALEALDSELVPLEAFTPETVEEWLEDPGIGAATGLWARKLATGYGPRIGAEEAPHDWVPYSLRGLWFSGERALAMRAASADASFVFVGEEEDVAEMVRGFSPSPYFVESAWVITAAVPPVIIDGDSVYEVPRRDALRYWAGRSSKVPIPLTGRAEFEAITGLRPTRASRFFVGKMNSATALVLWELGEEFGWRVASDGAVTVAVGRIAGLRAVIAMKGGLAIAVGGDDDVEVVESLPSWVLESEAGWIVPAMVSLGDGAAAGI